MTSSGTAKFRDAVSETFDEGAVLFTIPAGTRFELKEGPAGTTLICRKTADAPLSLDEVHAANARWLERLKAAAGGGRK